MVELERYAMANKIWATKLKRLRVPDLLCLDCGLRVEARAKSKLEIKVSDSDTEGREWDAGLRDQDLIALIAWYSDPGRAADHIEFFRVEDMRATVETSKLGPRKSASEGSERDRTWPARVASLGGRVESVDANSQRVKVILESGRRQTYRIPLEFQAYFYVKAGDEFVGLEQFLVGTVPPPETLGCPGDVWDYGRELDDDDPITRYIAVKATGIRRDGRYEERLREIALSDPDERIGLEAAAGLARIDPKRYIDAVAVLAGARNDPPREAIALAMEAIFILSELPSPEAGIALAAVASDRAVPSEVRSAAVWGLGVAGVNKPTEVLPFIADDDEYVALHALAGIGTLEPEAISELSEVLRAAATDNQAASASTLLSQQGAAGAAVLLTVASTDGPAAVWARAALGSMPERVVRSAANGELSATLETVLAPMWAASTSWLSQQQGTTPLEFLKRQTIRHSP